MTRGEVPAVYREPATANRIERIADSFQRLLGRSLVNRTGSLVADLWNAPDPIVAHGTEPDPLFFFANHAALERFETDLQRFLRMPSSLSAEAPLRDARAAFLGQVAAQGFVADYAGVRISAQGRRFTIRNGIVWNLVDAAGAVHGQAATFPQEA